MKFEVIEDGPDNYILEIIKDTGRIIFNCVDLYSACELEKIIKKNTTAVFTVKNRINEGCGKTLEPGQWWNFCGETDMGQTTPVLCTECGGDLKLKREK